MTESNFENQYLIVQLNYGTKLWNNQRIMKKIKRITLEQDNQESENLISVHFPKYTIGQNNYAFFVRLVGLKYITIMQPKVWFDETNEFIVVYQDYIKYQLTKGKLQKLIQENQSYRILLQLVLVFEELQKRNCPWPLKDIEDLYYSDGLIFLSLADYDINQLPQFCSHFQTFCQFVRQYFSPYIFEIDDLLRKGNFLSIREYLLQKEGNLNVINYFQNTPNEKVLVYLLQIKQQSMKFIQNHGNSYVKCFETPPIIKRLFDKLDDEIVYKSTIIKDSYKQQILTNIDREIELMEKFNNQSYMAVCFLYFRIGENSFLLQRKFAGTLVQALEKWKPVSLEQQQKDVYTFSKRFAIAFKEMQQQKIIHRDLKPENLFVDKLELSAAWIYVADFDRSKQLNENQSLVETQNGNCTPKYDPPEDCQTFKYDVFQYGLIVLTVANKGKYVGYENGPRYLSPQQYQDFYGPLAIKQTLKDFQYKDSFLQLLSKCLNREPSNRPDANEIYDVMNKLSYNSKIKYCSPIQIKSQNSITFSNSQGQSSEDGSQGSPYQQFAPQFIRISPGNYDYSNQQLRHQQSQQNIQTNSQYEQVQRQASQPSVNQRIKIIKVVQTQQQNQQTPQTPQ